MSNPFAFLAVPANQLVTGLAHLIAVPFGSYATAIAIVLGTVLIRLLLLPVGYAQHRADQRRGVLMGKVAELKRRHANNSKKLETELTGLYRAEGGGLVRGCLPMLVQIPVFAGLYQVFVNPANVLLQQTMFGVPLGAHLLAASAAQLPIFAVLIALLAAIGFASSRIASAPPRGLLLKVLPYSTAAFALFLPLAATLYLVTTTAWTVGQTVLLRQWS